MHSCPADETRMHRPAHADALIHRSARYESGVLEWFTMSVYVSGVSDGNSSPPGHGSFWELKITGRRRILHPCQRENFL